MLTLSNPFDAVAARYDELWTRSTIGRLQRGAVWRRLDPLFRPGQRLLDLGCGTGQDALHFMSAGIHTRCIDASPEMVRIARERGVDATQLSIEEVDQMEASFDGVISNFGALNCVENLPRFAKLIRSGGHLAICVIGRFCLWETAWYLPRGQPRKAFRRWRRDGEASSLGRVYYPSVRRLRNFLEPDFVLTDWYGIGITVPPSYVTGMSDLVLSHLARLDARVEHLSPFRALADHRLLIFTRR